MENTNPMRLICEYAGALRNAVTVNVIPQVAQGVKVLPGVGKPFLIFATLPPGTVVAADFDMYPDYIVSSVVAENQTMINAMLAAPPLDALTIV